MLIHLHNQQRREWCGCMSIVICETEKCEGFAANGWLVLSIGEIAYPETNSRVII